IGEAAVQSVLAGTDVLLVCHGYDNQVSVMEALKEAAENGTITEERIDRSVYRILKLMEKYRIEDRLAPLVNIDEINKKISDLLSTYIP
ncbi:MAG: beta-N-acetylhexosaminidase, partial [Clostridiaceae bacterium]|nr:beta-N-acetylhexosaminidase [Clostridiaceae bacterium]